MVGNDETRLPFWGVGPGLFSGGEMAVSFREGKFFWMIFREENPGEFFEQLFKFRGSTDIHTDLGGVIFHPDPGSTISTNRYMIKSTLKIARYCPLVFRVSPIF